VDDRVIVDVRQPHEVEANPLPESNARNIPLEELRERWGEIPGEKPLAIICAKGIRSAESVRILKEKGFSDVAYLGGGLFMRVPR
jgi:rhodanese-related sulfurtransferase